MVSVSLLHKSDGVRVIGQDMENKEMHNIMWCLVADVEVSIFLDSSLV